MRFLAACKCDRCETVLRAVNPVNIECSVRLLAARAPEARGEAKETETRGRAVIQHLHHCGRAHDKHDRENRAQTETRHAFSFRCVALPDRAPELSGLMLR